MHVVPDIAGIFNRVYWMQKAYPMVQQDVVAFKTSTCFVDHLWEMFAPLLTGNDCYIELHAACVWHNTIVF